jgi:hypothetical protein
MLVEQRELLQHLPSVHSSRQHSELVVHVPPDATHGPLHLRLLQMPTPTGGPQQKMSPEHWSPGDPQQRPLSPQLPLQQSSSPAEQKLPSERHAPQVPLSTPNVLQILLQHALSAVQLPPSNTHATQVQLERSNFCPEGQVVETQLPPHSVVPVGHWHIPLTHTRPSGQQVTLVSVVQTRASGQHVPSTQVVSPVWQQATLVPVPQGVLPAGHAAHVPLTQLPLQHSSPEQEPPIDRHVAHLPFVSQRSPLQQSVSTEQSPPLDSHAGPHTPFKHRSPCAQQVRVVPEPQS